MLSLLKLSKTTSPQKLFDNGCITLYVLYTKSSSSIKNIDGTIQTYLHWTPVLFNMSSFRFCRSHG